MASIKKNIHEVIVLGGGLMGSSAAWHLSNQGKSVLLLERQNRIYESGSSKGEARIVRSSNIENDELWSYLHNRSVHEVGILIRFLNTHRITVGMGDIYTTAPISYIAGLEELDQLLENLKTQEVDFKVATTLEEGRSRFKVNLEKGTFLQREYNVHSGTLNPKKLIQTLHQAIILKGNQVWYATRVEQIEKEKELWALAMVDAKGKSKKLYANQIICAAGPYTGSLLKNTAPHFDDLITPKRVFLAFLKIKKEAYRELTKEQRIQLKSGFPVIDRSKNIQREEFFAMIEKHDIHGNPIMKVGGHFHRSNINDPDNVWGEKLSTDELNWAKQKIIDYLNFLSLPITSNQIEVVDEYSCIYSLTETEVPYVTPILKPDYSKDKNFVVIAGMSGVGAKGAMTYGLIAANFLTNKKQEDPYYEIAIAKLGYDRLETKTL